MSEDEHGGDPECYQDRGECLFTEVQSQRTVELKWPTEHLPVVLSLRRWRRCPMATSPVNQRTSQLKDSCK